MAKIARRSSVTSNPLSLTNIAIPPTYFIEHSLNYTVRQYKRSPHSKQEIGVQNSISVTTPLSYSSALSSSSLTSLRTSSTLSLTPSSSLRISPSSSSLLSSTSVKSFSNLDGIEKNQLSTSSKPVIATTAPTTANLIDPLSSSDYQLTTRTIQKDFNNVNDISKQHHHNVSLPTHQTLPKSQNSHSIKNKINDVHKEVSKMYTTNTTPSTVSSATKTFTSNKTLPPILQINNTETKFSVMSERERVRMEFYATYDVMTGVRIAATLGGFFSLMVFLIVWKSRSHSNETIKALKNPKTAALTVACMQEEEDRKIIEAMDATGLSIFPDEYDNILFRRQRMLSVGNVSAPPILHRGFRFSSFGGYSSLLEPPRRFSISSVGGSNARRRSTSESSRILSNYPMGSSFGTDDYFIETDDELDEDYDQLRQTEKRLLHNQDFLEVPSLVHHDTRRSSAMTCCSTESSYLERRCSALTLGINNLPPQLCQKEESSKKTRRDSNTETWDYYYPDIQVIQATPKSSPLTSNKDFERASMFIQGRTSSQDTCSTVGSGQSSITLDNSGSSWLKNSMFCFYDPESLQDRKFSSIDSEQNLDFSQSNITEGAEDSSDKLDKRNRHVFKHQFKQPTIITTASTTSSPKTLTDKFDDMQELKLRKYSDTSSCLNNNTSFSYFVSNNNNLINTTGSCITTGFTNPPSTTYSVSRTLRSSLRGVGTIGGTGIGRAPLASCSSFKMSSVEYQDSDMRSSLGDDESVFIESYADTDDDLEQFSTDSDEISLENSQTNRNEAIQFIDDNVLIPTLPINKQNLSISGSYHHNSFYEHEISTKSAPLETINGKRLTNNNKIIEKAAILKCHAQDSMDSHRTQSVSSSDNILLVPKSRQLAAHGIGKKIKTKTIHNDYSNAQYSNKLCTSIIEKTKQQPLHLHNQQEEILLKPILSPGNTPLLSIKRSQFQQQLSDPSHSLPTTDETTTLETSSTEVPVVTTIVTTNLTGTSTTTSVFSPTTSRIIIKAPTNRKDNQQQYQQIQKSQLKIKKQPSFSYDNNNDSSISSNSNSNSINRNFNKHRSNTSKNTNKKFKIKKYIALSDSSVPSHTQSALGRKISSTNIKVLIPQLSLKGRTESGIKTMSGSLPSCSSVNYDQTKSINENIDISEESHPISSFLHGSSSIYDCSISLVDSKTIQQKSLIADQLHSSNLLGNCKNFKSNYALTCSPMIKTNDNNIVLDDNNKKQIVDVSIVIEGIESEDNSTDILNKINTNIVSDNSRNLLLENSKTIASTSVMLELPVIKIPTDIEDDESVSSRSGDDTNEFNRVGGRVRSKSERSDPPIRDPSLPSTARKSSWSKETLF